MNNVNIPAKRAYHHGNLRSALITAALRAIAVDGPEGFTLRDVARRAGVSPAAPYRHFKNKDELLAAVASECSARLGAALKAAVEAAPPIPLERYRASGVAYVRFAIAHPEHFRAISAPGVLLRLPADQRAVMDDWQEGQRRELVAAQAAGTITAMPIDELLLAANALVHGLAHMIIDGKLGEVDDTRAARLATIATEVLGVGLIPR